MPAPKPNGAAMRIELSTRAAADLRNLYLQGAEDFGILQAENYLATLEDSLRAFSSVSDSTGISFSGEA